MAITYSLAPIPKWVLINNEGTVAGGAKLYTKRSLNKIQDKAVYEDAGGTIPYENPIVFDANGTRGPFYWSVNSADLTDTYYLEAYDSNGNLLWTVDDYFPDGTGGGGGNTTTYIPLKNYIANNQFIDNTGDTANPIGVTNLLIAPSNHKGFTPAALNPIAGTNGVIGPDIRFIKNNTVATDQITYPLFALASAPLTSDVTPVQYVRYQCTNTPAGETYKSFQFPITQKVKNLSNQAMTFIMWGAVTATPVDLTLYVRQYFGSGTGASAEVRTAAGTLSLTTTWQKFNISLTIPTVAGKSIGTPGLQTDDDALYIQVEMPLGAPCDVLFTKPALYLGTINPDLDFDDYDQIDSINLTPRTGDIKTGFYPSAPPGWLQMNDGTIGNAGSGATERANADTFQLYSTLYTAVSNSYATVSGGRTGAGNTMANAVTDFLAGKTLALPRSLGRLFGAAGTGAGLTTRILGEYLGAETATLSVANLPIGTPFNSSGSGSETVSFGSDVNVPGNNSNAYIEGMGTSFSITPPSAFMNVYIKL